MGEVTCLLPDHRRVTRLAFSYKSTTGWFCSYPMTSTFDEVQYYCYISRVSEGAFCASRQIRFQFCKEIRLARIVGEQCFLSNNLTGFLLFLSNIIRKLPYPVWTILLEFQPKALLHWHCMSFSPSAHSARFWARTSAINVYRQGICSLVHRPDDSNMRCMQ